MNIKIQAYEKEYDPVLKEIWLEFVQDKEGSDMNIVPSNENAERWLKFVKDRVKRGKGALNVALINDEKIAGYIFYSWDYSPLTTKMKMGIIYDLYVKPEFRRIGIGRALLNYALNILEKRGVEIVQLNVMSGNIPAISLYENTGFVETMKVMRLYLSKTHIKTSNNIPL